MKRQLHKDPIPRPSTGTSDPAALAAQINAESDTAPSEWLARLLCPAMTPNHRFIGHWARPGDQFTIAEILPSPDGKIVYLYLLDDEGTELAKFTGTGPTVRAAYTNAHHRHRLEQHNREKLFRIASNCRVLLDQALRRSEALAGENDDLRYRLDQTFEAIAELLQQVRDLKSGLSDVRRTLVQVYPDGEKLALDKRITGLGKERDMWKQRALQAEAVNRAEVRETVRARQRVSEPEADAAETIPFPLTAQVGGSHVQ